MLPISTARILFNRHASSANSGQSDPRTEALTIALAGTRRTELALLLNDVSLIDWDSSFKEIPTCMVWLYHDIIKRSMAEQDSFEEAVKFAVRFIGYRLCMYTEHCHPSDIIEWVKQVVHDLYIEMAYDEIHA